MAALISNLPTGSHPVVLGETFGKNSTHSFRTIKYDSKPSKDDELEDSYIGFGDSCADGGKKVAVVVPKIVSENKDVDSVTVYRGQKTNAKEKDCLLLYDHDTGEFRLEQLSSQIRVKKTRSNETTKTYLEAVKEIRRRRKPTEVLEEGEEKEEENSSEDDSLSSSDSDPDSEESEEEESDSKEKEKEAEGKKETDESPSVSQASNPSQLHDDLRLSDSSDDDE